MLSKNNYMAAKIRPHYGHRIVCSIYGDADNPSDVCIECEDCNEVMVSAEDFNEPDDESSNVDSE